MEFQTGDGMESEKMCYISFHYESLGALARKFLQPDVDICLKL